MSSSVYEASQLRHRGIERAIVDYHRAESCRFLVDRIPGAHLKSQIFFHSRGRFCALFKDSFYLCLRFALVVPSVPFFFLLVRATLPVSHSPISFCLRLLLLLSMLIHEGNCNSSSSRRLVFMMMMMMCTVVHCRIRRYGRSAVRCTRTRVRNRMLCCCC